MGASKVGAAKSVQWLPAPEDLPWPSTSQPVPRGCDVCRRNNGRARLVSSPAWHAWHSKCVRSLTTPDSSSGPAPRTASDLGRLLSHYHVASSPLPAPQPLCVLQLRTKSHSRLCFAHSTRTISAEGCAGSRQITLSPAFRALDTHDLRRGLRGQPANRIACISRTRHARSAQRVARGPDKSHSRLCFARSTRTISAEGCAGSRQITLSPAFRALDTHDLRRGLRGQPANRTLACISRTRHARSPQRVARGPDKSHSRLHFAHSTRTISAEGCARTGQIALSPAFRALDTHDLRRGLRGQPANRTLACISRTRHARSPQRVARGPDKSHSHLHFAHSTRTISAEGCARTGQIALSPAFRALDTHDLRRGLRAQPANRTLTCISRTRHARSPQRVARGPDKSHSRLHFAHSTRTISAEGCARTGQIALSPAFRALDTHDLRRGLRAQPANRTLACISRTPHARSPQRVALSVDAVRPTLRL